MQLKQLSKAHRKELRHRVYIKSSVRVPTPERNTGFLCLLALASCSSNTSSTVHKIDNQNRTPRISPQTPIWAFLKLVSLGGAKTLFWVPEHRACHGISESVSWFGFQLTLVSGVYSIINPSAMPTFGFLLQTVDVLFGTGLGLVAFTSQVLGFPVNVVIVTGRPLICPSRQEPKETFRNHIH